MCAHEIQPTNEGTRFIKIKQEASRNTNMADWFH